MCDLDKLSSTQSIQSLKYSKSYPHINIDAKKKMCLE